MVGHCPHCDRTYCAKHRLPEDHKCLGLEGIKGRAFEMNKEKLEREAKEAARGPVAAV
ncbi:hypothetical protein BT69DRAFT_1278244 [Atractiella rhizophila]|nr:hypothetical protein BT69DRAFT_1278244 [Atractiella rhizophila]